MIQLATSRLKRQAHVTTKREARAGSNPEQAPPILKPGMIFAVAVWLGLATGLLELGLQFARRHLVSSAALGPFSSIGMHSGWCPFRTG